MALQDRGEKIDERLLHDILNEIDLNKNGEVDLMEFLQVLSRACSVCFRCFLVIRSAVYSKDVF